MNQKQQLILAASIGLITGAALDRLIFTKTHYFGVLKIDTSNPEKDLYNIEVHNLDGLSKKRNVVLKVKNVVGLDDDTQKNQVLQ